VLKLAADFLKKFPGSKLTGSAMVAQAGASDAAAILRKPDVRLFRSAFQAGPELGAALAADLEKAARGDKDAAARLGRHYAGRDNGRYEGWMQYAAELGNGIASYQLALHYRRDQPSLAQRYEDRARHLGYTPPPSLDNTRK
jgi:hypothetical protein